MQVPPATLQRQPGENNCSVNGTIFVYPTPQRLPFLTCFCIYVPRGTPYAGASIRPLPAAKVVLHTNIPFTVYTHIYISLHFTVHLLSWLELQISTRCRTTSVQDQCSKLSLLPLIETRKFCIFYYKYSRRTVRHTLMDLIRKLQRQKRNSFMLTSVTLSDDSARFLYCTKLYRDFQSHVRVSRISLFHFSILFVFCLFFWFSLPLFVCYFFYAGNRGSFRVCTGWPLCCGRFHRDSQRSRHGANTVATDATWYLTRLTFLFAIRCRLCVLSIAFTRWIAVYLFRVHTSGIHTQRLASALAHNPPNTKCYGKHTGPG